MPYWTEGWIKPPNNDNRARHALLHVASEWLTHWTTWAGRFINLYNYNNINWP